MIFVTALNKTIILEDVTLAYQLSNIFRKKIYIIGVLEFHIRELFRLKKDLCEQVVIISKLKPYLAPPMSTVVCRTKGELKLLGKFRKDLKLVHAPLGGGSYKISGNRLPKKYQHKGPTFTTYYYCEAFRKVAIEQEEITSCQGQIIEDPVSVMRKVLGDDITEYWAQLSTKKHPPIFLCPTNSADYADPSELQIQLNEIAKRFKKGTCVVSFHPLEKNLIISDNFDFSIDTTISLMFCDLLITDVTSALHSAFKNDIKFELLNFIPSKHRAIHPSFRHIFKKN